MVLKGKKFKVGKSVKLGAAVLLFLLAGCGVSARTILVEAVKGSVTATGKETVAVVKGEKLTAGDEVVIGKDSDLTLLLDADRHIYAGESTDFLLNAKGKKTEIELKSGRLTIGIDNKLAKKETFDVTTSNAVMSVRGTVFTVIVTDMGGKQETTLSVESGSIEVKTVEDGEEKTYTVGAGESHTFNGTAPGKKKDDKAPVSASTQPPKYKRTRTGDGPEVDAIFEGGRIDTFAFNEDYDAFKAYNTEWTLDLKGNTVELIKNLEINTTVTIINGTLVTFDDAWIVNKHDLILGYEKSTEGSFTLWTHDKGIENSGLLDLRSFKMTVDGGVGIENSGEIINTGYDSYDFLKGETEGGEKEITVNSGTFLVNTSNEEEYNSPKAMLGNVFVTCNNGCAIENKGFLRIEASEFSGSGDNLVINREGAKLSTYLDLFNAETDGTVGCLNEGYIYCPNDLFFYVNNTGTGLINKGEVDGYVWTHVYNGLGVDNFGKIGRYFGEVEGGLGVIVEKGGDINWSEIVIKSGDGMINHGMIEDTESDYVGKGYDQSHRLYLFVTADEYTGTALLNEEDGNIYGELEAYASGFDGGCLVNNKGSMEIDGSRFCVGLKVSEIERWDAFSTGFENSWRHCEVKYVLDPAVSIKNSTIIKDVGNSRMMHTESVVSGKGEGDNTFWHMSSGKHLIAQRYDIFMYGSGMTGLMIDSGTALAPDDDDFCDIDVMIGENPDNAVTAFGKTLFNGENCKNSVCFKNYGIINNGTVGSTEENRFRFKAELYGSESVGFYNNGTFDVRSVEGQVGGTLNTGILNLTSIDADETVSGYAIGNRELEGSLISGGNIGIDNPGIIHANSLVATAGDRDFEYHKVTSMTEGKEGKDVGVKSTGIIELVLSKNNTGANFGPHSYSPAGVGLFTSGSLSARNLTILNTYGTAMQCAEGSVTYVSWLEVGGYNGQQDYDKYYCLGISLAGILELRTNEAGGQSQIKISASHGRMGMQITETGSLINRTNDYKNYNYFGAYGSGSICVSNYGHIDVGLVDVTKSDGAKYTDVISDHGIFSYKKPDNWTQDRHYEEGPYGMAEYPGCAGPWSGVFYHPGTLD